MNDVTVVGPCGPTVESGAHVKRPGRATRPGSTPTEDWSAGRVRVARDSVRTVRTGNQQGCRNWRVGVIAGLCLGFLTPVAAAAQLPEVEIADGRLTVTAHDAAVKSLIEEVAVEAGLTLEGAELLDGNVTVQFQGLAISDGLARILGDRSYMLVYAVPSHRGGTPVPVRLRFFGASTAHARPTVEGALLGGEHAALFETLEYHGDPWDKQDTIEALAEAGDPAVARRLGKAALADADVEVRSAAVEALATLGGDGAVEMLEIALHDTESAVRRQAIGALEEIGGDTAVRGLTVALQDVDADLRLIAIDALGGIGGPRALQLLEHAATDPNPTVRDSAAEWLAELRAESW